MVQSTASSTPDKVKGKPGTQKPKKPYEEFPLFAHATGRWAKKIRGKMHYFGPWADPDAALAKYLDERDDLHAGRTPRVRSEGLTIRDLLNRFLTSKQHTLDAGEITRRTFADYHATCERIKGAFGLSRLVSDLASDDFERLRAALAKTWGPVALGNEIQRVRVVFKYGYDAGLVAAPVRFGPAFKRPSKKTLRKARNEKGPPMFSAAEISAVLGEAAPQLKAMILLGINAGMGNSDCGRLPLSALDLEGGWINYPRPKTGIQRRCPLWPETVEALRVAIAARPEPKPDAAGLVFVTRCGMPWAKDDCDNPISKETAKLVKALGFARPGLNFYALRHTFATVGGEARDQPAVDHIMGHEAPGMAATYRETIGDDRLRAVADVVRAWLFPAEPNTTGRYAAERRTVTSPS